MASQSPKLLNGLQKAELKVLLRNRNSLVSGNNDKLRERLRTLIGKSVEEPDSFDFREELSSIELPTKPQPSKKNEPRSRIDFTPEQKLKIVQFVRDEHEILYGEFSGSLPKHAQQKKWIDFLLFAQEYVFYFFIDICKKPKTLKIFIEFQCTSWNK